MSPVRALASALSLINGVWAVYLYYAGGQAGAAPPTVWLAAVGAVLAVVSVVGLAGVRTSFALALGLSALVLVLVAARWASFAAADSELAAVLSVLAIVLDAVAFRPAKALAEKDSPLNLPVFG